MTQSKTLIIVLVIGFGAGFVLLYALKNCASAVEGTPEVNSRKSSSCAVCVRSRP